ncbi:hypothetical protein CspeluHIS016_0600020 [Cutaneotrichosporon spelunceum]|uniref:Uncharacterized protein n=1 Tax=Cutaneotrichosporon spelunceum TaxID=1672016 RepID=A0AAD3TX71_9TREE|nr:hypothetical protein CspeluHIS016_0600020 [Cutaneotrichosporon spelunceum]
MRIINELNKINQIGKQFLSDLNQDNPRPVSGAPPPPLYAQPQHAMSYPPPSAPSHPYPTGPSYPTGPAQPPALPPRPSGSGPVPVSQAGLVSQGSWPPPNSPPPNSAYGAPQSPPVPQGSWPPPNPTYAPLSPPLNHAATSGPTYTAGYTAQPQTYDLASPPLAHVPALPPQGYQPGPSFAPYPSAQLSPPQSFTTPQAPPFGYSPMPGLSPATSSAAAHTPQTPHIPYPPSQTPSIPNPTAEPVTDPADWLTALQLILPRCLGAARNHVAIAHTQPDTIWLYFVDLGPGQYFADAVYGIDGNAFGKDDLAWAGLPPNKERSTELYRVLAGEWVTKICMRSKVEAVHPSRVVVKVDVATGNFGSTMCYEVASVRHPTLRPEQVLTLWVSRVKATANDSAEFMPA